MYHDPDTGILRFSPSDLTTFLDSEFASWMDRWYAGRQKGHSSVADHNGVPRGLQLPGVVECEFDAVDEQLALIKAKGVEHELRFLERLRTDSRRIAEFDAETGSAAKTLAAMQERHDFIYQARLEDDLFGGFADFLACTEGESVLGDHHYEAWDTKLARSPRASFIIQLCAYTELLEHLQGRRPAGFEVVLGTNERVRFLTHRFHYYYRALKRLFLDFQQQFDPLHCPHPGLSRSFGRWTTFAEQLLEASDHMSLVANITRSQIKKLEASGITTLTDLAGTKVKAVPRLPQPVLHRLRKQALLQLKSRGSERPLYEVQPPDELTPRRGLAALPPRSAQDVYFDMEGFPLHEGGLEYLFGAVCLKGERPQFVDWWAHDDAQEKAAFEGFVDWVHARWRSDPSMHIYHYAPYETSAVRNLMGKHATRESQVDDLLRNQVFVDLYAIVRQGLIVGTPSFSLKDIERLYMPPRAGKVTTAGGSVVAYHHWLESDESQDWRHSGILKEIRDYNEDDCVSTWQLCEWLRKAQTESQIRYVPLEGTGKKDRKDDASEVVHPAAQLAERLLAKVDASKVKEHEPQRVQQLLAWLLEFHRREPSPSGGVCSTGTPRLSRN